jgi:hypothetical protein
MILYYYNISKVKTKYINTFVWWKPSSKHISNILTTLFRPNLNNRLFVEMHLIYNKWPYKFFLLTDEKKFKTASYDMNKFNNNNNNILDLPNEILQFIFNKLNTVDMLYSLVDVNQRFDRLTLHSLYIHHLNFAAEPSNEYHSSMYAHILELMTK